MYHSYFGLTEQPFSIAVDPRYLFMSARHRDALAHLLYGVGAGGGFILLTGPVGTGKTTITRSLLEQLPQNTDLALVLNPSLNAIELLATICDELDIAYEKDEQQLKPLTDKIYSFLLDNFAAGKRTVLLIDEAQHLHFNTLEQIRLLTNLETNTQKLLQIILVGQPELKTLLQKPELSQLAQRITARYQLTALNLAETGAYIKHRLHIAGLSGNQQLFPDKSVKMIFDASKGIPRIINVLCDRILLGCYGKNKPHADKHLVMQAIAEVKDENNHNTRFKHWQTKALSSPALLSGVIVTLVAALLFSLMPHTSNEAAQSTNRAPISNATDQTETFWYHDKTSALTALAQHTGSSYSTTPCNNRTRCEELQVSNWQDLQQFQHPVTLKLYEGIEQRFANLIKIDGNKAQLSFKQQLIEVELSDLSVLWRGEFTLLWQPPEQYRGPVKLGDKGPVIRWLALQFSQLDQQTSALTDDRFNRALHQRVMIFQQNHQLTADGIAGLKTLLKLQKITKLQLANQHATKSNIAKGGA